GVERVVELIDVDRERLQLAEDVGEPEADEADLALRHDRLDILRRCGQIGHARLTLAMAPARRYRRLAKATGVSVRRRRRRSWRRLRLPCPGRAGQASVPARARGLRR